jgi:CheY-like chemotaxis protein
MPKNKVLIVEDEQDIAGLIKHTLERGGDADVEIVGSGDAALKAVSARPPDLIILDLNLPVLSGVVVCRILRGRQASWLRLRLLHRLRLTLLFKYSPRLQLTRERRQPTFELKEGAY